MLRPLPPPPAPCPLQNSPPAAPVSRTRPSSCPGPQKSWRCSRRRPARSSPLRGRRPPQGSGNAPAPPCPKSARALKRNREPLAPWMCPSQNPPPQRTCIVTVLSSTSISLVRKSAPIVALYSLENFFCTYWFISDVLPTLRDRGRGGGLLRDSRTPPWAPPAVPCCQGLPRATGRREGSWQP
jgi:hypothetical protein